MKSLSSSKELLICMGRRISGSSLPCAYKNVYYFNNYQECLLFFLKNHWEKSQFGGARGINLTKDTSFLNQSCVCQQGLIQINVTPLRPRAVSGTG